jgi:probable dihydroxyacetone kinase regulator
MAQFTKKAIMLSFLKLLNERPLEKITVKDIVEDCGVSRNTFYYYYEDLYALLDDLFREEGRKAMQEPRAEIGWHERLLHALQFVMVNRRMLYNVFHSVGREKAEDYLYSVCDKILRDYVEQQADGLVCSAEDKDFVIRFYKYAFVGMLLEWVESGMKDEPQIYIDRIGLLFEGDIRAALIRSDPQNANIPAEMPKNRT